MPLLQNEYNPSTTLLSFFVRLVVAFSMIRLVEMMPKVFVNGHVDHEDRAWIEEGIVV